MYLEKLDLFGFKSFAEKTDFLFESGLTAVVGPNGCGKSNVVDAIKWVMGEQSVKSLRGNEMADVIFSGTTNRKPLGYAEVSLSFSNTKHILPVDYDQVVVTRRLYRSGESEYFLNKARCRLKDIRELFMGTGVGTTAYTVIEQGKIDVLLQANPQERRVIFEEAAGISKYKVKKRTALSKLDRVEQNLLRLGDIIAEVQKQMKSLQRQVGKARRFREYTQRLKELKTQLFLHQYHVTAGEHEGLRAQVGAAQTELGNRRATVEKLDAEASRLSVLTTESDQALRELQTKRLDVDNRIRSSEATREHAGERIREAEEARRRYAQEIDGLYLRLREIKAELVVTVEGEEQAEGEIQETSAELAEIQEHLKALADEAAQLGRQIQDARAEMIDITNEQTRYTNTRASLESDRRLSEASLTRGRLRQEKVGQELAELGMVRKDALEAIRASTDRLDASTKRLEATQMEIRQHEDSLVTLDERLAGERDRLAAKESRRELLQDLERRREGMGAGVKQVLNAVQQQPKALEGVVGTVADLVEVDVAYAVAVEAALAAGAQTIITEKTDQACLAVDFLRKDDRGRATFFPLERVSPNGNGRPPVTANPSYLGYALNFVRVPEAYHDVVAQLLSGTHVVKDFQSALELAALFPKHSRFVTLDGEVVCSAGPITGGSAVDRLGLISRRSELRQLLKEILETRERMAQLAGARGQTQQRLAELRQNLERVQDEITRTNIGLTQQRSDLDKAQRDIANLEQEQDILRQEAASIQQDLDRNRAQVQAVEQRIQEARTRESELTARLAGLEGAQRELDARKESLRERSTKLQAALAGLKEKAEGLRVAKQNGYRTLKDQKDLLLTRFMETEQCDVRILESQERIRQVEEQLQLLFREREQRDRELQTEQNRREEIRTQTEANAAALRQISAEIRTLEEQIQDLRVRESRAEMKRNNLVQQAHSELNLALPEAYTQGAYTQEANYDLVAAEVDDLEQKIRNLGNVYEDAIEEYEVLELRAQTLVSQEQDLLEAKKKLQEIIRRINRTSRRLFETTFQQVRENFQVLFKKLFGGGRADVFLEEGADILEAGIEIVARPPGKSENTVLSLLSGGEKALCTVALLFAIFRARPSPFCILDEVDAPLDESNIDRFVALIQEFNVHTQFIMITHNRRTMRAADTIYGITMQEPGVSGKVSVRFEDIESRRA